MKLANREWAAPNYSDKDETENNRGRCFAPPLVRLTIFCLVLLLCGDGRSFNAFCEEVPLAEIVEREGEREERPPARKKTEKIF